MTRVGIVGAGFMGRAHGAALRSLGVDITIWSPDSEVAAALAAECGAVLAPGLEALLESVDVVDVCAPTDVHRDIVEAAARAGKHVICEKPIAMTVADGEAMLEACRDAGVRLFVAHVVRYFPEYAAAREAVEAGRIGRPAILRLRRESFRPRRQDGHWLFDERRSGGLMLDLMVHDYDFARAVAGEVDTVFARAGRDAAGQVDYALAALRHASGAISHVTGSWAYPAPIFRTGFELAGDGGLIEYESVDQRPIAFYLRPSEGSTGDGEKGEPEVGLPLSPLDQDPYALELADFLRAIESGTDARVTAEDGVEALRVALAAIESAATGQPVRLAGRAALA